MTHKNISDDLYREHILELYKSPENYGKLEKPTHKATEYNTLCGDEITMHLIVKGGKISEVKFSGSGCVMSIVSASMLTNKLKNLSVKDVKEMNKNDMLKMLKLKLSPSRIKCALLPLEAAKKALM